MPEIKANGNTIYYEVTGTGYPFVFIHAGGLDTSSWHSQSVFFSERYSVITYDVRGHGRSEDPEGGYSMGDCVEDLHQLLAHLAIEQAYLAGLSMGGNIALNFTLSYPGMVDALILAGSNSGPMIETTRKRSEEIISMIMKSKGTDAGMQYQKAHEANVTRPDLTDRLSEIMCPALIIVGDRDTAAPIYLSEALHRGIANSEMVVIPNCGHRCNLDQPDNFNAIVSEFLQRIEAD